MGLLKRTPKPDEAYDASMSSAIEAHEATCAEACAVRDKIVAEADAKLAAALAEHERVVGKAQAQHEETTKTAHASKARASKLALRQWMIAQREELAVPESAFVRRDKQTGALDVHAGPGAPSAGTAVKHAGTTWAVRTGRGTTFVGGELAARRKLLEALMEPYSEVESAELVG